MITCDTAQIDHTLRCDRFTKVTHSTRHNMVRDAMARVAMQYGISTIKEPTTYTYEAGRKRPDLLFQTSVPIATDITIVMPDPTPMDAADRADKNKTKTHEDAVKALGHCCRSLRSPRQRLYQIDQRARPRLAAPVSMGIQV